jgi:hypothetical protein
VSWRSVLSAMVIVSFVAFAALANLLPLYTDEVASKAELARTLIEGGRLITLVPQCHESWISKLPLSWLPGALYYHVAFSRVGLFGIRLSAIVMSSLWLGGVSWVIFRRARDRAIGTRRVASFLAMHAIGVVPLTLFSARAESTIISALVAYVAFPILWPIESRRTIAGRAAVTIAFVFVTSIVYLTHPKMLFFTPVVIVSTAYTFTRRRPGWLAVAALFVGLTVAQTYAGAKEFVSCPESPDVERILTEQTLSIRKAGVTGTAVNFVTNVETLVDGTAIDIKPRWLPLNAPGPVPVFESFATRIGRLWLRAFVYGTPIFVALVALRAIRRRAARARALLASTIVIGVIGNLATKISWPFYASGMVIGALALAAALAASIVPFSLEARLRLRTRRFVQVGAPTAHVVAIVSMIAAALAFAPGIIGLARRDGTLYPEMPAWVPAYGFSKERPTIRAHAERCGIAGDGAKHLVVDDATFFAFDDMHEPLHLIYVTDTTMWGNDRKGARDIVFLSEMEAPGIVTRCAYLPSLLENEMKRAGDYCCTPPPISFLAHPPIDFGKNARLDYVLIDGWSFQEERGRWTTGETASFVFAQPEPLPQSATLHFEVYAALLGPRHEQHVDVSLNGMAVGTIHVGEDDNDPNIARALPVSAPNAFRHVNRVELRPRDRRPATELGGSETRPLGIFLRRFWFD